VCFYYLTYLHTYTLSGVCDRMEVHYTGFPTPEVHWYREGVEIQPSRDFQITHLYQKSYLVVPEVFLEDAGTFTVRAISPVGMAECRALLVVDGQLPVDNSLQHCKWQIEKMKKRIRNYRFN